MTHDYEDYRKEALMILSDEGYYQKINFDPFPAVLEKLQNLLTGAISQGVVTKKKDARLSISSK